MKDFPSDWSTGWDRGCDERTGLEIMEGLEALATEGLVECRRV